jgi:hypothetical protein
MSRETRVLSPEMEDDFLRGTLQPLLEVVQRDRDLILEFLGPKAAAIYCKGHRLGIQWRKDGCTINADTAFLKDRSRKLQSAADTASFVTSELPFAKQRIAEHRSHGTEIEYEQLLIRANNMEPNLNTDYFAVERQVLLGAGQEQIDVLGVHWPGSSRGSDEDVALALIEVKYTLGGGVEKIAKQVAGYYDLLVANIGDVASEAQALLRQKLRLGLITGATDDALKKLAERTVSNRLDTVKVLLALVDYSPRSTRLNVEELSRLKFPVQVFRLGLGLWDEYAQNVPGAGTLL